MPTAKSYVGRPPAWKIVASTQLDELINTIAPGDTRAERFVATRAVDPARMVDAGTLDRIATVDEVSRIVEFFAGPMGAFVSGQVTRVDGGGQTWAA